MTIPVIPSERVRLRPIRLSDAQNVQKYFAHWEISQQLSDRVPWPYPDDGAETFLRDVLLPDIEAGKNMAWAITLRGDDDLIGIIECRLPSAGSANNPTKLGDRGFWIAKEFWGQGYMTEAIVALQDYLFFELGIDSLEVTNAVANRASSRIKQKTGATLLGVADIKIRDEAVPFERWVITREAWQRHRQA